MNWLSLSPHNPLPHLAVVVLVVLATTALAIVGVLNEAVVGLFGAALGTSGTAMAVQRHVGQIGELATNQAVATAATAAAATTAAANGHDGIVAPGREDGSQHGQ